MKLSPEVEKRFDKRFGRSDTEGDTLVKRFLAKEISLAMSKHSFECKSHPRAFILGVRFGRTIPPFKIIINQPKKKRKSKTSEWNRGWNDAESYYKILHAKEISLAEKNTLKKVEELVKKSALCSYPKADTQKEHNKNMTIVDDAGKEAKEQIIYLLNQVKEEGKTCQFRWKDYKGYSVVCGHTMPCPKHTNQLKKK